MKTVYAVLLFASLQGFGQDYARQASWTENTNTETEITRKENEVLVRKNGFYEPGDLNNIPAVVFATFKKEYPGAINVSWFLNEKFSTVYCNWENELVIRKYTNDGTTVLTRKTYTIEKLDRPFTDFLKREIGDAFDMNYITEFIQDEARYYEINMTNKKEWLVLKITRDPITGILTITEKKIYNR